MQYQYDILFMREAPNIAPTWVLTSNPNNFLGQNLFTILNHLGQQGWRVAGMGDFANSARSEIVLMRP